MATIIGVAVCGKEIPIIKALLVIIMLGAIVSLFWMPRQYNPYTL